MRKRYKFEYDDVYSSFYVEVEDENLDSARDIALQVSKDTYEEIRGDTLHYEEHFLYLESVHVET